MKQSDQLNLKLARYLDEKFESVSIYPGDLSSPGPDTVWFDVDPSSEGWLVIRRLKAFLECYGDRGRLEPYTYLRALPTSLPHPASGRRPRGARPEKAEARSSSRAEHLRDKVAAADAMPF